jgi:hypothetical protein
MPDSNVRPYGATLDREIERAGEQIADSVTFGLARRPLGMAVCALVWALSLPAQLLARLSSG